MIVDIPASAQRLADKAEAAGWEVRICTAQAPDVGSDLEPAMEHRWEDNGDGTRSRIPTDVRKIATTVSVRCRRGADYVFGVWAEGAFDFACRPSALTVLTSAGLLEHLQRPLDDHRWIPRDPTTEVCVHHAHTRERVPA